MGANPESPGPRKKKRWLRRIMLAGLLVAASVAVFHRPLLRWAFQWGGPRFAPTVGLQLKWAVDGTVTSDLSLDRVHATGDRVVQRLDLHHLAASYSLVDLAEKGTGAFLKSIEIEDADVALDLRSPSPPTTPSSEKGETHIPALSLPRVIIRNLSADVVTASDDIVVRGLTIEFDPERAGEIRIDEFIVPSQELHLLGVRGRTEVRGNTLVITDLTIMNRLTLKRLVIDLEKIHEGHAAIESAVAIGEGTLAVKGATNDLGKTLTAEVTASSVTSEDLMAFGLVAAEPAWRVDSANVRISGAPTDPQKLHADMAAQASAIRAGNVAVDRVAISAGLSDGKFALQSLGVEAGGNRVEVSGQAALPDDWQKLEAVAPTLQWKLAAPELQRCFVSAAPVSGALEGTGSISLAQGKLQAADANLTGNKLMIAGVAVAALQARVATDGDSVRVKALHAELDEKNSVDATGELSLKDLQPAKLDWRLALGDLALFSSNEAFKSLSLPLKGQLQLEGGAEANLAEVLKADISRVKARSTATITALEWQQYAVKTVTLTTTAHDKRIDLEALTLTLNDANVAHVSGSLSLDASLPFDLKWQLDCKELAPLVKMAGMAAELTPTSGIINGKGDAKGALKDVLEKRFDGVTASASVDVNGLAVRDARLDSFNVNALLAAGRVNLQRLALRLDADNTLDASGHLELKAPNDFEATVTGLFRELSALTPWTALAKAPPIEAGSVDLAWKGRGQLASNQIDGAGTLAVNGLRLATMPDPLTALIKAEHKGVQTEIASMETSVGKFHASAKVSLSPEAVRIPALTLMADATKLVEGSVDVPIALGTGSVPIDRTKPLSVKLKMDQLDFAQVAKALGQESPVSGMASMDVDLHGPLPQLEGLIKVDIDHVVAMKDKLDPASAKLEAVLGEGRLKAHLTAEQKPLKPLDASAEIPVDISRLIAEPQSMMDEPITAHVVLPESDLEVVKRLVPAIEEIKGRVGMDVSVSGQLKSPKMQGQLRADLPLLHMKAPEAPEVKDARARVSFEDEHISIEEISAILAGGSAKITGKVDLTTIKNPAFDIQLTANEALLMRDQSISQRANANLRVSGALAKADVSGRVDLTRGRVFKEIEFLPLTLPEQLPPPPPPAKRIADDGVKAPPPFDQWTFNVDVGTHDPVRLLGNVLNGGVLVDLHARGTGAAPTVEGKVTLDGARLRLPFSRLAITRGNILFSKEKFLNPELDIEGDSLVDRYQVTMNATGSVYDPKVRFTSSPPLSEGDIATLLATGATSEDLRSAEGVAANKAAFLFVTQMYRKIFKKTGKLRYDDEPPKLSFSFSLLNSGSAQRSVSAVYEISPKVQAVGSVSERGGFRGLLYYLVRFP